MRSQWLLTVAAFTAFSAGPWMHAQIQDQNQKQEDTDSQKSQSQNRDALPAQDDDGMKHDGGKADVDAVGNRNVGCERGVGNWFTLERQVAMGQSLSRQVEAQVKLISDPVVTEYVNRVGQNLVRNSDSKVPFTIKVIDSDVVNAMALPGGFFYVNSGLILAADEEAEMAGAMAHEIAHVAACHIARQITRQQLMQIATIPILIGGGGIIGYGAYEGSGLAGALGLLKFSRQFEAEADYLGVQYMYRTGYDPSAMVTFFEKVRAMEKRKTGTLAKAFDTHPQTAERIAKSQDEIRKILPAKAQYLVTTSEFDEVKARLVAIENKHKVLDEKDANKPALRRTANPSDKSGDDDHPNLKRRDYWN